MTEAWLALLQFADGLFPAKNTFSTRFRTASSACFRSTSRWALLTHTA